VNVAVSSVSVGPVWLVDPHLGQTKAGSSSSYENEVTNRFEMLTLKFLNFCFEK
jgi:hypothetical protein